MSAIEKMNDSVAVGAREYLTFRLDREEYGIDILKVQEIRGYEPPTRIANAPSFIKGVVNLRGTIVPIVDMRLKFSCANAQYDAFTVVIILNLHHRIVGIVVDSVSDVMELSAENQRPAPEVDSVIDRDCVIGLGALADRMLILLDIEKLMSGVDMGLVSDPLLRSIDAIDMSVFPSGQLQQDPGLTDVQGREFDWSDADFSRVQTLIYQRAGISLHDGKHAMVYSRLSRRLRETGYQSFKAYLSWLETQDGPEWQEFINALTTNLTSFFREQHHFQVLSEHLKAHKAHAHWRVWCSAASTGEEPYSILMTAVDALGANAPFKLMASDIDSKVLATAGQGVYRLENLKNVTEAQLQKYFLKGKATNSGMVRVKPELQRMVEFIIVNLVRDDWPFREPFDVVFCRNVMIYFDAPTQRKVLERIHRVMVPGGLLFVGHAENFSESRDLFVLKGKTVYERR